MEIFEVEKLFNKTKYEPFIGSLEKITLKNYEYDNLYKMGNNNLGYFVVKIRQKNQINIMVSINSLKTIIDTENIINKNTGIIEKEDTIITISEWVYGTQPIDNNRDTLPTFFSKLAKFNIENITEGPYMSMYLDCKYFNSISEMVDFEINYHKKYFTENMNIKIMLEILENLKKGIPCIINEDMNCGNFFITNDGKHKIIDTEWIINGNNLYQFQHFDYFGFDKKEWYKITDEAKKCYKAYFGTLGMNNEEANKQIRAIELLNTLRENTYWKYSGKDDDKEIERRINIIIGTNNYL